MKTTLFIPFLNEIEGLKLIMPRIQRDWVDEILFVDAHSTDGSREWLQERGYKVVQQEGRGLAMAYWTCFDVCQGDVIVAFSPDNNSVPEAIPQLIEKIREGYDMAIASRYLGTAKSEDDDTITGFGNRMFTWLINLIYGGRYTDSLVMYRAFRKDLVRQLDLTRSEHPLLELELVIRALKHGLKITEIPADEPKRIGGVRKMRIWYNGSAIVYVILKELFTHRVKKAR
jgi:glycosyltransferase involved in cell wall biosynthesis